MLKSADCVTMPEKAIKHWPEGCEGAYICFLSNPQNLNIGELLGDKIEDSPFDRILGSGEVTHFVMLGNCNTPIPSRLWVREHPSNSGSVPLLCQQCVRSCI